MIQRLIFNRSVNSIPDTLEFNFVLISKCILHPIEIPNVSACKIIVAVKQYAHVALRVVKHRRVPSPGNKADDPRVPR